MTVLPSTRSVAHLYSLLLSTVTSCPVWPERVQLPRRTSPGCPASCTTKAIRGFGGYLRGAIGAAIEDLRDKEKP